MSQSGSFGSGGGTGGAVITLTGDTGGAITAFAGNIFVLGELPLEVEGNLGAHSLTVVDTSKVYATVTTVDATPTALYTFPLANNEAVTLNANIIAADTAFGNGASGTVVVGALRAGGGSTLIGIPTISIADNFAPPIAVNALISGTNLIIEVTGIAATTIDWVAIVNIVTV